MKRKINERLYNTSSALSAIVIGIGILCLLGWIFDISVLKSISPEWSSMKPNSAIMMILLGYVGLHLEGADDSQTRRFKILAASTAVFLASLILLQYIFHFDLKIDQALFADNLNDYNQSDVPGRPSISSTLAALSLGIAYLFRSLNKSRASALTAEGLTLLGFLLMLPAFIGYLYGVREFYSLTPYTHVALPTCIAGMLLALSHLLSIPQRELTAVLASPTSVGQQFRYILALFITIPVALGWFRLQGELHGLYDSDFGLALMVLLNVVITGFTTWFMTKKLVANQKSFEEKNYELAEKERQFRQVADSMPQFVWSADSTGKMDYMNRRFIEFAGFDTKTNAADRWDSLIPPSSRGRIDQVWQQAIQTTQEFEVEFEMLDKKTHSYKWYLSRGTPVLDQEGQVIKWYGSTTDINYQKIIQDKLRASEERLQAILNYSPNIIYMKDLSGRILMVNQIYKDVFHKTDEQVIGKLSSDIWPSEYAQTIAQNDSAVIQKGQVIHAEELVPHPQGVRTYLSTRFPIFDVDGNVRALGGISTDITNLKQAQQEKSSAEVREKSAIESSRLKSEFLATMSHEIRTPINGIMGMTNLLQETSLSEEQLRFVSSITKSSSILLTLINDILDLSKIESGKLELEINPFSMEEMIRTTRDVFQPLFDVKMLDFKLRMDLGPNEYYLGDASRIRQILNNFIGNALKFTSQGSVELAVDVLHSNNGLCDIKFSVKDSGIGISTENQTRLFQKFSQGDASTSRKFGGTGLGLAICKEIAELMNGAVGVTSDAGLGSTFYFIARLPLLNRDSILAQKKSTYQFCTLTKEERNRKRILIAEDNVINQEIVMKMLEKAGYKMDAVGGGAEALVALQTMPYDAVLMDCQMPDMDGYETTRAIRRSGNEIRIIALTANAYKEDRTRCLKAGMNDYLPKPVVYEDLIETLDKWLSSAGRLQGEISEINFVENSDDIFSQKIFDQLAQLDGSLTGDLLRKLYFQYQENMTKGLPELKILAQHNDDSIGRKAHALKSGSANLGALKVTAMLQKIEDRVVPVEDLQKFVMDIETEFYIFLKSMEKYIAERFQGSNEAQAL